MQLLQTSALAQETNNSADHPLVLVVDDQPAIRDVLYWMLRLHGYQPVCSRDGQEALAWMDDAQRSGEYPVAILLDMLMPGMDGAMFLTSLRARWHVSAPVPPIILLTVDKSTHEDLECATVLRKPFHLRELCESLELVTSQPDPIGRMNARIS